jgi:hypothetical protein
LHQVAGQFGPVMSTRPAIAPRLPAKLFGADGVDGSKKSFLRPVNINHINGSYS